MTKSNTKTINEIISLGKNSINLFRNVSVNERGFVLLKLPRKIQLSLIDQLGDNEIVDFLEFLDLDDITDILQNIDKKRRKKIVSKLKNDLRDKIEFLLKFNPKSAAGLMDLDYIELDKNSKFSDILSSIKKHEKRTGRVPVLLVVDDGKLIGELPEYALVKGNKNENIGNYTKRIPVVSYDKSEKDVIRVLEAHPHNKVAVLDADGKIIGIIYSDDIIKLLNRRVSDGLRDFAGIKREEDVFDSPLEKVKNRYGWLIANLATAFLAASVVGLFEQTIAAFTLLAVYMPIVAGMGGNAGTQTLAVMVRGIALKEIDFSNAYRVIVNEMIAGGINGIINAILVAMVAILWNSSPVLGLVIGISMVINLIIAGLFGAIIPLTMKSLGKDPASSATIFITTATDVFGFFVFLGLAALML